MIPAAVRYLVPFCSILMLGLLNPAANGQQGSDVPTVRVETIALRQKPLSETVQGFGTVATTDEATADISFPHPGEVTALNVRVGETVRSGRQLATLAADPATLLGYQRAVAALDFAQRELDRTRTLFSQHLATNAQIAAAQKAVTDAIAALEAERKLGNDQPTRALTAPFDGFVSQIMIVPGDRLAANTAIMKLTRTDRGLRVTVGLKPENVERVRPGMKAQITPILGNSIPSISGVVSQISGTVNAATRLIDAWVDVPPGIGSLFPGTSVTVAIVVSQHTGWVVPRNAVLRDDKGSYIFQVSDGLGRRVDVRIGIETDEATEVIGDFNPSLAVVRSGNYELHDGMAVREAAPPTQK